eukprot:763562-Hanusia_phi.AAC.2
MGKYGEIAGLEQGGRRYVVVQWPGSVGSSRGRAARMLPREGSVMSQDSRGSTGRAEKDLLPGS